MSPKRFTDLATKYFIGSGVLGAYRGLQWTDTSSPLLTDKVTDTIVSSTFWALMYVNPIFNLSLMVREMRTYEVWLTGKNPADFKLQGPPWL